MKTPSVRTLGFAAGLLVLSIGCFKEVPSVTLDNLSPFAKKFLSMHSGAMSSTAQASNLAINKSYQGATAGFQAPNGNTTSDSTGMDTTIVNNPWSSCGTFTEINNSDGSHTSISDYGDGCNAGSADYKYFMHGKFIQTYLYTTSHSGSTATYNYLSTIDYLNYGGTYYYNNDSTKWNLNGSSSYSGESTYDTVTLKFSGHYDYSDSSSYESGTDSYSYLSQGKSHYDDKQSVTEVSNYRYASGDNYYESVVTVPLVSNYSCYSFASASYDMAVWITYVSGHEVIKYRQDGVEGSFEIDYGNGDCDNRIYITENGKVIPVDLANDWNKLAVTGG